MSDKSSTIESLIFNFAQALAPLESAFASDRYIEGVFKMLGWQYPPAVESLDFSGIDTSGLIDKLLVIVNSTDE